MSPLSGICLRHCEIGDLRHCEMADSNVQKSVPESCFDALLGLRTGSLGECCHNPNVAQRICCEMVNN
ncbi:hypothetical protein C2E31_06855 [Rhodopirellula baltica]|nr:hypothetical protein C2E31_06855 [Rhodopirellula baltica]